MRLSLKVKIGIMSLALCLLGVGMAGAMQMKPSAGAADHADLYDNWKLECATPPGGQPLCRIFQRFIQASGDKKQFVLAAALIFVPPGPGDGSAMVPHLRIITPDGVDLPTGVVGNIDKGQAFKIPFQICGAGRCVADGAVAGDLMARLGSGKAMTVAYRTGMAKPVTVEISLKGFPRALQALKQKAGNTAKKS